MIQQQKKLETLVHEADWIPVDQLTNLAIPEHWHSWLLDETSLTKRLIEYSNDNFKVEILKEFQTIPTKSECQKLAMEKDQVAQIREVALCCNDSPVVLARSVIPLEVVQDAQSEIAKIGDQPLGHFLFKEGRQRIRRRDVTAVQLDGELIFGRRTPYQYKGNNILVAEFFISDSLVS